MGIPKGRGGGSVSAGFCSCKRVVPYKLHMCLPALFIFVAASSRY